jgi:DNA-binding GntR family transcriptional regulator
MVPCNDKIRPKKEPFRKQPGADNFLKNYFLDIFLDKLLNFVFNEFVFALVYKFNGSQIMNDIIKIGAEKNLNSRVCDVIRDYLLRPDTPPGLRLYEEELSKKLGVSRTPVKAALSRLEQEGLVSIVPNRGAYKVQLSWQEAFEIIKVRGTLESLSLEMAQNIDRDKTVEKLSGLIPDIGSFTTPEAIATYPEMDRVFHEELIKMGNSPWIPKIIKNLDTLFHLLRMVIIQDSKKIKMSIQGHKKIIEALRKGDVKSATKYMVRGYEIALQDLEEKRKIAPGLFRQNEDMGITVAQ